MPRTSGVAEVTTCLTLCILWMGPNHIPAAVPATTAADNPRSRAPRARRRFLTTPTSATTIPARAARLASGRKKPIPSKTADPNPNGRAGHTHAAQYRKAVRTRTAGTLIANIRRTITWRKAGSGPAAALSYVFSHLVQHQRRRRHDPSLEEPRWHHCTRHSPTEPL